MLIYTTHVRKLCNPHFIDGATEAKGFKYLTSGHAHSQPVCLLHHSVCCPREVHSTAQEEFCVLGVCVSCTEITTWIKISPVSFLPSLFTYCGSAAGVYRPHVRGQ